MKNKIIRVLMLEPVKLTRRIFFGTINLVILKTNNVRYNDFPIINGKLIVVNRGTFILGSQVKFNSSLYSNLVGLYKPCSVEVQKGADLQIGDFSGFSGVSIYCANKITIGNYLCCGGNVSIWDTDFHPQNFEDRRSGYVGTKSAPIKIGDDVFIGANSIILKGVEIGDRAIVGAGSVVTKNIPNDEVWAGNPAKKISAN
ncbi:MAG: acyltransferase [Bacteroidetes bacterium]|nr:MAG: acyltransferase [Bacteroidota bacterium]